MDPHLIVTLQNQVMRPPARSTAFHTKNLVYGTAFTLLTIFGYLYITDTRAGAHRWLVVPCLRWIYNDAEEAHEVATETFKWLYELTLNPRERVDPDPDGRLAVEVFNHTLSNPMGTSGGLDKHGEIPSALLALGPAVVEIGGITPLPQDGNAKPRVFRIPSQSAIINRYGLNSVGAESVAMRLRLRVRQYARSLGLGLGDEGERKVLDGEAGVPPGSLVKGKLLAVQIAKNSFTPESDIEAVKADYVACVKQVAKYADILVVNVSSPNTPGLRTLQQAAPLASLLAAVVDSTRRTQRHSPPPAVMVKVSPDEDSESQIQGICDAIIRAGVDGVIVGNTTKTRPAPIPRGVQLNVEEDRIMQTEAGGLSGPQLFEKTLRLVGKYREVLDGRLDSSSSEERGKGTGERGDRKTIFASGGITTAAQAKAVLDAGASVAMVYTVLVYGGVGTISALKRDLVSLTPAPPPAPPSPSSSPLSLSLSGSSS
ncbi:MAG: Dihydroorotate dehydrogenase (quinone), mitochondrial [Thelocarpon superellum]|nr:MAG: Dihydroorotate dehydrogenase (quinone), mitochondrial [Thelocarpon superellum]